MAPKRKSAGRASSPAKEGFDPGYIVIRGAREHNLKGVDLSIPRGKLVVFTGISGSGKSSLAFDTIYAEGQRRYLESLSTYARQFLGKLEKPQVDQITGLSPAIAIEQKAASHNPRSTVGTVTEVYDYMRVLWARLGVQHCYRCGKRVGRQTVDQIVDALLNHPEGTALVILAPKVRGRKGEYRDLLEEARRKGFTRVRVDGEVLSLDQEIKLDEKRRHDIEVVVDRLKVRPGVRSRIAEAVETALEEGEGQLIALLPSEGRVERYSERNACVECGISYPDLNPNHFSFNSPYGRCEACDGLGVRLEADPDLVVPNPNLSLAEGAVSVYRFRMGRFFRLLRAILEEYGGSICQPFSELPEEAREVILRGGPVTYRNRRRHFEGVLNTVSRLYHEAKSEGARSYYGQYMRALPCPQCEGKRLRPESLAVRMAGKTIDQVAALSIADATQFFLAALPEERREEFRRLIPPAGIGFRDGEGRPTVVSLWQERGEILPLSERELTIGGEVIREILRRLGFLKQVGLHYLTLDRSAPTLSGGESQRIRLASQIGSGLTGVLYILDEPSIGLHQRDNLALIRSLQGLRDLGNTVIVVEHDREMMEQADFIVDFGPGAGVHGGEIVVAGPLSKVKRSKASLTGAYLRGEREIPLPEKRRTGKPRGWIKLKGCRKNNLKDIEVAFPLGRFICITGVSGSGKSSLITQTLWPALHHFVNGGRLEERLELKEITGLSYVDRAIAIDQSPIGRTPRSNPATYTKVFDDIRRFYAELPESRLRGYRPGRFSFNVKGGRCEACQGQGEVRVEMHFLADVWVRCEECQGRRYNRETLEVRYKGLSISDVLELTVEEALEVFANHPAIRHKLTTLAEVGLGYIKLGQSAPTLSGGEAQRVKLARELSKRSTGSTVYILDEPTTGLHFEDILKLLNVLQRFVDEGNTVIVIEHNLDVIKCADWIIDLGPEGGEEGGRVVAVGTPEELAQNPASYTGLFLRRVLGMEGKRKAKRSAKAV